jgi:formamidopyrimidine-DNA glycosylase
MPELPEVEAVVRQLRKGTIGADIKRVQVLRARSVQPQSAATLMRVERHHIEAIDRRGKNIVVALSGGLAIRVHLRMTGILRVIPDARLHTASTRVMFTLSDGRGLAFEDRRVLGTVHLHDLQELEAKLSKLGPEPLSRGFTAKYLTEAAAESKRPVKIFLMDQEVVAGIGNIYAAEALFAVGIHPSKPANRIRADKLAALHATIPKVLRAAVREAIKWYSVPDKHEGMRFNVYGRKGEPCNRCATPIRTIEQGGRTTYYCPRCQRK